MINVLTGIILGPAYAAFIALAIGMLRIGFGTGTIFAISGGVPGAIVVGLVYHYVIKRDEVALTEPLGTTVGALISASLVAPFIGAAQLPSFLGLTIQWELYTIFFLLSSIPGAALGYILIKVLRRSGMIERLRL
jgi:energy coupling factor transporter S component ThiW